MKIESNFISFKMFSENNLNTIDKWSLQFSHNSDVCNKIKGLLSVEGLGNKDFELDYKHNL